jgi:hypothetical protein
MYWSLKQIMFATFFFFISFTLISQQKILILPGEYLKPHYKKDIDIEKSSSSPWVWIVFSHQDNNVSYDVPNGKPLGKSINFLDPFYVTEKKDEFLHIFKDEYKAWTYKKLGPTAEDFGWIKINQVLPTRFSLLNDQDVPLKAILLNTLNTAKGDIKDKDFERVRFFKDPELKQPSDYECKIYSIFYIYDFYPPFPEKEQSALLGTKPRFEPNDKNSIKGWVNINYLTLWSHRVALLPNPDPDAIKERKAGNVKAKLFDSQESARKYRDGISDRNDLEIWNGDSCWRMEMYDPYFPRYPVLDNRAMIETNHGVMKIGIIGLVKSISQSVLNKQDWAHIQRDYNEKRESSRNINIIFVIDGTTSMQPYFTGASNAIISCMNDLQNTTTNIFRFGVVIYRDKDDGEALVCNTYPLTNSNEFNKVATWLQNQKAMDTEDKDPEEAVYYGITNGLRKINLTPEKDQTNYVILIGDCGNHPDRPNDYTNISQKQVIDLLFEYNCFFMAFQVRNTLAPAYVSFVKQSKEILNALEGKYYQKNVEKFKDAKIKVLAPSMPKQSVDRKWYLDHAPFNGFVWSQYNSTLPGKELTKEIVESMKSIDSYTSKYLDGMQKVVENGDISSIDSATYSGLLTYLAKMDITSENIKILADKHVQLYYEGYSSNSVKQLSFDVWQNELLFSMYELSELIQDISKIPYAQEQSEIRERFVNAWKDMLKAHLGHNPSVDEFENMTLAEIELKLFGAVGSTPFLDMKVQDFLKPNKIKDPELMEWIDKIAASEERLNEIYNQTTQKSKYYSFDSNGIRYFWIPQSILP